MVALSANKQDRRRDGNLQSYAVKSGETIYAGALVCYDQSSGGGLIPCAAGTNREFVGVSVDHATGGEQCQVHRNGSVLMTSAGVSSRDIGKSVYASDDQTVSTTQGSNQLFVGVIVEVISATQVRIDITNAVK